MSAEVGDDGSRSIRTILPHELEKVEEEDEDQIIGEGEFVLLPGGVVHMHGATADAPTTHISMMLSIDSDFETDIPASWERFRAPRS